MKICTAQVVSGELPSPRQEHCAVYDAASHQMLVFGGRAADHSRLNDTYSLDTVTWAWARVSVEGSPPTPRSRASAALIAGFSYFLMPFPL